MQTIMSKRETRAYHKMVEALRASERGETVKAMKFKPVPRIEKTVGVVEWISIAVILLTMAAIMVGGIVCYKVNELDRIQAERNKVERMAYDAGYDNPSNDILYIMKQELNKG